MVWLRKLGEGVTVTHRELTPRAGLSWTQLEDVMACRSKGSLQLLPPMTLNSDSLSIVAAAPQTQPVVHLGGQEAFD